jgi:hypothetical protein
MVSNHRHSAALAEARRRVEALERREYSFAHSCPEWRRWIVLDLAEGLADSARFIAPRIKTSARAA